MTYVGRGIMDLKDILMDQVVKNERKYQCPECSQKLKYDAKYAIGPNWVCENGHRSTTEDLIIKIGDE